MTAHRTTRLLLLLLFVGCGSRAPLQQDAALVDGELLPDSGIVDTSRPVIDAALLEPDLMVDCAPALRWGFVSTAPEDIDDESSYEVTGQVRYWGSITEPLASSPEFKREVQLVDDYSGQTLLVLQYFLPQGQELPIVEGEVYTFTIVSRWMWEGRAQALLISQPGRAPWPVIFVGEPALVGQALDLDDPLISPVRIEQVAGPACGITATICGEGVTLDPLRFEFSTGAGIVQTEVEQGKSGTLSVFGKGYTVTNLASHSIEKPCEDEERFRASYLIIAQAPSP